MSILLKERIPRPYEFCHDGGSPTFDKYSGRGILLFSALDTNEETNIASTIEKNKIPCAILPLPLMPEKIIIKSGEHVNKLSINGVPVPLEKIGAVWYLCGIDRPMEKDGDIAVHNFELDEWRAAISILFTHLNATWINNPSDTSHKRTEILRLAENTGLNIPRTIITNDMDSMRSFQKENGDCILKRVGHSFPKMPSGDILALFNRKLERKDLRNINLRSCPVMLQQYIDKKYDYRIYIVGEDILAFRVYVKDIIDWREAGAFKLMWEYIELDNSLLPRIKRIAEVLNLKYAAIDLVEDNNGNMYFLEVNANGTHEFVDHLVKPKISERIAELLISIL